MKQVCGSDSTRSQYDWNKTAAGRSFSSHAWPRVISLKLIQLFLLRWLQLVTQNNCRGTTQFFSPFFPIFNFFSVWNNVRFRALRFSWFQKITNTVVYFSFLFCFSPNLSFPPVFINTILRTLKREQIIKFTQFLLSLKVLQKIAVLKHNSFCMF